MKCEHCGKDISPKAIKCRYCYKEVFSNKPLREEVMVTSTDFFDGYEIIEYMDLVQGEVVCANGLLGVIQAGNFFTIDAMNTARRRAIDQMKDSATAIGANAIVGVDVDIAELDGKGVMVSANGTAVYVLRKNMADIIERENIRKQEQRKKEKEDSEAIDNLLNEALGDTTENSSPLAKLIVQSIKKMNNKASAADILKLVPRNLAPAEIKQTLDTLTEKGIIVCEAGIYSFKI